MESFMMQRLMMASTVGHGKEEELPALKFTAHAVEDALFTEITGFSLLFFKM
jgi:hypothetical protein